MRVTPVLSAAIGGGPNTDEQVSLSVLGMFRKLEFVNGDVTYLEPSDISAQLQLDTTGGEDRAMFGRKLRYKRLLPKFALYSVLSFFLSVSGTPTPTDRRPRERTEEADVVTCACFFLRDVTSLDIHTHNSGEGIPMHTVWPYNRSTHVISEKILGWRGPKRVFLCFLAPLEELGGSKNQANNSTSICEKVGFLMLCLDPLS